MISLPSILEGAIGSKYNPKYGNIELNAYFEYEQKIKTIEDFKQFKKCNFGGYVARLHEIRFYAFCWDKTIDKNHQTSQKLLFAMIAELYYEADTYVALKAYNE